MTEANQIDALRKLLADKDSHIAMLQKQVELMSNEIYRLRSIVRDDSIGTVISIGVDKVRSIFKI